MKNHNKATNVVLMLSKDDWEVLSETLRMDSQSSTFDLPLRRQIAKAYAGVTDVTADVAALLDEVEMVPRASTMQAGACTARFVGEDRIAAITKLLRCFRSDFTINGGRRNYSRKVV